MENGETGREMSIFSDSLNRNDDSAMISFPPFPTFLSTFLQDFRLEGNLHGRSKHISHRNSKTPSIAKNGGGAKDRIRKYTEYTFIKMWDTFGFYTSKG